MAGLTVGVARPGRITSVGVNYGMQGSTYNPQKTATVQQVQPASSGKKLQPAASGKSIQNAASIQAAQAAATAAQVAAAAEAARRAAEAEAARQREIVRQRVQNEVNVKVATNVTNLRLEVGRVVTPKLTLAKRQRLPKIDVPDYRTPFEKARDEAYLQALREVDRKRDGGDKKGFAKVWDKLTFGQDRRDVAARSYAEKRLQELTTRRVDEYSKKVNAFLKDQAARKARVEGTKFTTQAAYDRAVQEYGAWEVAQIGGLEQQRAQLTGFSEGLKKAGSKPLGSTAAKLISGANNAVAKPAGAVLGKVWQYTLGQGDKNIPSLVTAPSRVVNFVGNLNTPGRTVYQEGGKSSRLAPGVGNAWTATQTQRNFNIKPWTDIKANSPLAHKLFDAQVQSLIRARGNRPGDNPDKIRQAFVENYNRQHRNQNSLLVNAADPLLAVGWAAKGLSSAKFAPKVTSAVKATKFGGFVASAVQKASKSKAVTWLRAESKLPHQRLAEALDVAKVAQGQAQKSLLPRINAINRLLAGDRKLDVSILHEIEKLTDDEAAVLQRMVDGKLSGRDRLRYTDIRGIRGGMTAARQRLEDIARRYTDFTEQLKFADEVIYTRFGRGKKFYAPNTTWIDRKSANPLDEYNFFKRRGDKVLKSGELYQGIVDRYFKSKVDNLFVDRQVARRGQLQGERDALLRQYDESLQPVRDDVQRAYAKTRTPYGRARTFLSQRGPLALWKKSVLKYRPAWYVNNALYNIQAAALSGGSGAFVEHARLLRPRNFRNALADVPAEVATKLTNEIGRDRISRFGNNLENWSRLAAFRAAKKKGLSDEAALKRVNKYLLDYTTKNWERPIKAVAPFWSFQKGLAKAAVQMPTDRPLAAIAYNQLDKYQQQQFDTDFDKVVPRLKELGYSAQEIASMRAEQSKYFAGRVKVGNQYITTPFNAFSEKGLSNLGINPYLAAMGEVASATDSFGRPISGREANFTNRFISKFPQAQLAKEGLAKALIASGRSKPMSKWIGAPGSEGYGLTKEAQGYDPKKPNYQKKLDPGAKFSQDLAAFFGKPRGLSFDATKFLDQKTMQKLKTEYFATDWKSLPFDEQEKRRNVLFRKYGVTADRFYKGELSKYDSVDTKRIKVMKEDAFKKTQDLFAEYGRQPKGVRNVWATQKLRELVDSGYFAKNPFLMSFDWTSPATIAKAYKKIRYDEAKATGDWSSYEKAYGVSAGRQKFYDYQAAKKTGDWFKYHTKYGMSEKAKTAQFWQKYYATPEGAARRQLLRENPQYARGDITSESDIAAAKFWTAYAQADRDQRKKMLAENPQYNNRLDWTPDMWAAWRAAQKQQLRGKLAGVSGYSANLSANVAAAQQKAMPVVLKKQRAKTTKKLVFSTA